MFGLMVLAWAGNYLFVRLGEQWVDPLWLAALRAGVGAVALGAYLLLSPRPALSAAERRDAILLGVPNTAVFLGLWFVAARGIAPGEAAVVVYTFPLWVALLSPALLRTRLSRRHWVALGVGFAGVVLVSQPWASGGHGTAVVPLVELVGAAVSWAVATVLFQRRFAPEKLATVNGFQLIGGAIPLLAAALLLGQGHTPVAQVGLWISVLWLGVFGTAFAYAVWFYLLRSVPAATLSAYSFLVPLPALGLSAAFLGERVTAVELAGVVFVVLGIYLVGTVRGAPVAGGSASSVASAAPVPGERKEDVD